MSELCNYLAYSTHRLIGLTGPAGSGKTSLVSNHLNSNVVSYSIDYRFIGDSAFRSSLLLRKSGLGFESYVDMCNQINWWDWVAIETDVKSLLQGNEVSLNAYQRDTGDFSDMKIVATQGAPVLVEGALLGPHFFTDCFDIFVFVVTDPLERLLRLIRKDKTRRDLNEVLARFLITEYSENVYYNFFLHKYKSSVLFVNDRGDFVLPDSYFNSASSRHFVPFPIYSRS